ncbi:hypothetical protein NP569_24080, partial [Vibrio parahaemolyticus]|nr:hypothetical protein [Vibrio parahaemolyticus]
SRDDNKLMGLHWGGGNVNVGVSAQNLNFQLGHFIENSNNSIIGLGKVSSTNLELTPIRSFEKLIPLYLSEGSRIQPFYTVKIEGYDDYSIMQVEAIDLVMN